MVNEQNRRRPDFVEGTRVRMADGQDWSFPDRLPSKDDREHIAVLREILEVEDRDELLGAELALTIFLLARNYDLTPDDFAAILRFAPGDPAQPRMQAAVHALAMNQVRVLKHFADSNARSSELPPNRSHMHPPEIRNRAIRARSSWLN
jgi:hypothetical protein